MEFRQRSLLIHWCGYTFQDIRTFTNQNDHKQTINNDRDNINITIQFYEKKCFPLNVPLGIEATQKK